MKKIFPQSRSIVLTAFVWSLLVFTPQLRSQTPSLVTKADSAHMLAGSRTTLHLILEPVGDCQVVFPALQRDLTPFLETSAQKTDTVYDNKGKIQALHHQIVLTSFAVDTVWIPSLSVEVFQNGNPKPIIYTSDSLPIIIDKTIIDTTGTIKDIAGVEKEPYTLRELLPLILILFGTVAAVAGGIFLTKYIIRKRRQQEPLFAFRKKPKIPPYREALEALEVLRKKHLWQNDRVKEYYSELTDIVREYINKRYHIPATEMTSGDICRHLADIDAEDKPEQELIEDLQDLFSRSDLVKFAKQQPLPDEHERSMKQSIRFVSETAPQPETEDPDAPHTEENNIEQA